jgi:ankyrin repeat protein
MTRDLNEELRVAARAEAGGRVNAAAVSELLAAGADPHAPDATGETAFNYAAANAPVAGRLMTLFWLENALAGRGIGLNDVSGSHRSTLAQYIAKWLHDDEIGDALARGAAAGLRVDVPNGAGWTPLTAAAAMGRVAAVRALLPYYGRDALCHQVSAEYRAVYNGHEIVYAKGLNAAEIAETRMLQDEDADEETGSALWECADLIVAAIRASKG